jgi:hypothetical protein
MPFEMDSEYYNMNHKRRVMAIIFYHTIFDNPEFDVLHYPKVDSDKLKYTLEGLGFEVTVYNDLEREDLRKIVNDG